MISSLVDDLLGSIFLNLQELYILKYSCYWHLVHFLSDQRILLCIWFVGICGSLLSCVVDFHNDTYVFESCVFCSFGVVFYVQLLSQICKLWCSNLVYPYKLFFLMYPKVLCYNCSVILKISLFCFVNISLMCYFGPCYQCIKM